MSTLTQNWTKDKIRLILERLDEKTGLHGASLPIEFSEQGNTLGCYYRDKKSFGFNPMFFDNPILTEAVVIDTIRHEYAHYYADVADLQKYVDHSQDYISHGEGWRWACNMVGARPDVHFCPEVQRWRSLTEKEAQALYDAEDVKPFDILSYVTKWHQVPVDPNTTERYLNSIRRAHPDWFHNVGDEVFHRKSGFGVIRDIVLNEHWLQKAEVLFENNRTKVYTTGVLCKAVNGTIIPPNRKSHISLY